MRYGIWIGLSVGAIVTFFCLAPVTVGAASMVDVAAVVGESHGEVWTGELTAELEHLGARSRIAGASFETAVTVFQTQRINGTPAEAARLVFEVIRQVDKGLRRGDLPGKVLMDARRAVTRLEVGEPVYGYSARLRLRRQLSAMGSLIYGELEQRAGPQSSPGSHGGSAGSGSTSGGSKGKTGSSGNAAGDQSTSF